MPLKPMLSDEDRERLRNELLILCERLWIIQGYKKTSIKELCARTRIAIGTFYSMFPTKEALFYETSLTIQNRLKDQFLQTVLEQPNKEGFAAGLKKLFREFDRKPFLYDVNTPDFRAFVTKLSEEEMQALKFESLDFFDATLLAAHLQLKVENAKAYAIFSALLSTLTTKMTIAELYDYFNVFDFMVDTMVNELFE
ncbi:TetR family transcriptional regulator [Enterococcus florum]|uniref:TetR family transcriptional regulator n=1 Tax=Enterococcus florum TaxID=2480627 RepID=A0A4P5PDM4_9ENTE|nr:TetR/AcrR family transcriptional regulator [Enterococcus florum]GCF94158.1 TetR family transcriptional regulator [Enterococcus florum]